MTFKSTHISALDFQNESGLLKTFFKDQGIKESSKGLNIQIVKEQLAVGNLKLWAQFDQREGHRFIESRANYNNHLDPFEGISRLFFSTLADSQTVMRLP